MAFVLKGTDRLEREQHHRAIGPTVEAPVALTVAVDAVLGDQRLEDTGFRHAAA